MEKENVILPMSRVISVRVKTENRRDDLNEICNQHSHSYL
jgi:hypothetical protein